VPFEQRCCFVARMWTGGLVEQVSGLTARAPIDLPTLDPPSSGGLASGLRQADFQCFPIVKFGDWRHGGGLCALRGASLEPLCCGQRLHQRLRCAQFGKMRW